MSKTQTKAAANSASAQLAKLREQFFDAIKSGKAQAIVEKSTNPDTIVESKMDTSGAYLCVTAGGKTVTLKKERVVGPLAKLVKVGGSLRALQEYIKANPVPAKLAKGLDGYNAPHSVAAYKGSVKNAKQPAPTGGKAPAAKAKAAPKASTPKAGNVKHDPATKLTVLVKAKDTTLKQGSDRYARLAAIEKCTTLGAALAKTIDGGKPIKMDNIQGMIKRGHVRLG